MFTILVFGFLVVAVFAFFYIFIGKLVPDEFIKSFSSQMQLKAFQVFNRSPIVAVPAVKPGKIFEQFDFWQKWIKPDGGFFWYAYTSNQEFDKNGIAWTPKDLGGMPEIQIAFKKINNES